MDRLIAQLQRLYFLPGQLAPETAALEPVGPDGRVRTMAVGFAKPAHWEAVADLYRGMQEDLELPPSAISVSGKAGFEVWFSLAEPVPADEARGFLEALRLRYLAHIPVSQLRFCPGSGPIEPVPARHPETGKWSAFIDPSMGSMFADEAGLEMAPNREKQADLLAGVESIKAADFRRVQELLLAPAEAVVEAGEGAGRQGATLGVGSHFSDPRSFLLAVMNDPAARAELRVEAAKALLPYFEKGEPK